MKTTFARSIAVALLALFFAQSSFATCGGGGGGGGGGMSNNTGGGGGGTMTVYNVPWKVRKATDKPAEGLILYWFPSSQNEMRSSSLRESRILSLYAAQCVSMELADGNTPHAQELVGDSKLPIAALAKPDGSLVGKVENTNGKLKIADVEKLVQTEMKQRESGVDALMTDAAAKVKSGDNDGAIKTYKEVVEQKCLFPKKAKDAQKQLKSLGVADVGSVIPPAPIFDRAQSAAIERVMRRGLIAEMNARYVLAGKLYHQAHLMDPADPTPLRYTGENLRHNIGDWNKARAVFQQILDMPADPLSRSVAFHGLGKMTIHDGEFKKGLSLMEQSIAEYPLALAYRNLAVYWNSEGDPAKGNQYTEQALALDPKDPYNLVFAAVFMAANGRKQEALKIARENINLMPASYNLAAIYAQNGQKEKALSLLRRHFFQYERYQAVREKEMMEARVDAVFDSIRFDREFIALTHGADGKLPVPMKGMPATQAGPNR
ncbi:MAG TPA: tetratricopeptide repeat protein [Pyrinomonadaceae bacterium]|nr:tetratricopeptide repeat protein [Pyrinomonadaceae bacterium]